MLRFSFKKVHLTPPPNVDLIMNKQAKKLLGSAFKNAKGNDGHKGWYKRRVSKQTRAAGKALCRGDR